MSVEEQCYVPILMHQQHIEPLLFSFFWHKHLDAIASELVVHSCIFDVSASVHSEMRSPFTKKYGLDFDTFCFFLQLFVGCEVEFAKVVEYARDGENV